MSGAAGMDALAALSRAAPGFETVALVCAAVAAAAVLRGVTGFGFALAAVPLLGTFLAPSLAVTVVILLQVMIGALDVIALGRLVDRPSVARLSLGALAGTPAGVALLAWLDPALMRLVIAAVVAAGLGFLLRPPPSGGRDNRREALPAGVLAGLFGGLAAMAGPPAVAYFLRSKRPPTVARASLIVFFFVTSLIAMPGLHMAGLLGIGPILLALIAFPVFAFGAFLGSRLFERTTVAGYRRLAIAVLAAMALASGLRGLAGVASA